MSDWESFEDVPNYIKLPDGMYTSVEWDTPIDDIIKHIEAQTDTRTGEPFKVKRGGAPALERLRLGMAPPQKKLSVLKKLGGYSTSLYVKKDRGMQQAHFQNRKAGGKQDDVTNAYPHGENFLYTDDEGNIRVYNEPGLTKEDIAGSVPTIAGMVAGAASPAAIPKKLRGLLSMAGGPARKGLVDPALKALGFGTRAAAGGVAGAAAEGGVRGITGAATGLEDPRPAKKTAKEWSTLAAEHAAGEAIAGPATRVMTAGLKKLLRGLAKRGPMEQIVKESEELTGHVPTLGQAAGAGRGGSGWLQGVEMVLAKLPPAWNTFKNRVADMTEGLERRAMRFVLGEGEDLTPRPQISQMFKDAIGGVDEYDLATGRTARTGGWMGRYSEELTRRYDALEAAGLDRELKLRTFDIEPLEQLLREFPEGTTKIPKNLRSTLVKLAKPGTPYWRLDDLRSGEVGRMVRQADIGDLRRAL
jgi:hypothetical protein